MTYVPHVRITWSGTFGDPSDPYEEWSFGLAIAHDDGSVIDISSGTGAEDAAGYGETFLNVASTTGVQLTQTKLANIGADGHYTGPPQIFMSTTSSGAGAMKYPPQVSLAVSTWSDATVYPRTHGRFYVPGPRASIVDSTSLAVDGDITALTAAAKTLIDSLNGDFISSAGHVVIPSQKGAGHNYRITEIRVGHAFDTVRSRRKSLKESYTVQAIS